MNCHRSVGDLIFLFFGGGGLTGTRRFSCERAGVTRVVPGASNLRWRYDAAGTGIRKMCSFSNPLHYLLHGLLGFFFCLLICLFCFSFQAPKGFRAQSSGLEGARRSPGLQGSVAGITAGAPKLVRIII